jgi:hypothetical protein
MVRNVLIAIAASAAILAVAASASPAAPAATTATTACVHAKIGATTTCLVAGRPCRPRYEKQYRSHGFRCRRNTAGHYRLWQAPLVSLPPAV